jgi:hypothetical protein
VEWSSLRPHAFHFRTPFQYGTAGRRRRRERAGFHREPEVPGWNARPARHEHIPNDFVRSIFGTPAALQARSEENKMTRDLKRPFALVIGVGAVLMATAASADPPPRDEIQAPRSQEIQAPRDRLDEVQSPRGQQTEAPRDRTNEIQAPRGQELRSPRF